MSLTKLTKDLSIISKLSDEPNDTDGLTADELKAKFDEAGNSIKDYLNNTLTLEMDNAIGESYKKPGTGIPKTDLAEDVQTSLGKADTALQAGALPAGGTDGDVLVKNGATDYDATWKKTPPQMGSLATIEPTSTVTQKTQYVQGEYLVYNGQLYKVTASTITQGQTLTPGGNIEVATVGEKLTGISHLHWGGNCMGLARSDGRVNVTLPYQGDYTHVEVNTTQLTAQGTSIYGSKASTGCTFELQDLRLGNSKVIYFNLQPSVNLATYTDLAKQVMIFSSQEIVFTLS